MVEGITTKQENFARFVFEGLSQRDAYQKAYDCENMSLACIDSEASHLMDNPKVTIRLAELRSALAKRASIMPVQERQERLSAIARADLADFVGNDGDPRLEKSAAISEYETVTYVNKAGEPVTRRKLKLHNSITAIAELNKMDHVYETASNTEKTLVETFVFVLPNGTRVTPNRIASIDTTARELDAIKQSQKQETDAVSQENCATYVQPKKDPEN